MDSPTSALIGVAGIGVGALIFYGAYRNVSVFGPNGLIGETIATGQIPSASSLPKLFGITGHGTLTQTTLGGAKDAITDIAKTQPQLAAELTQAFSAWNPTKDPGGTAQMQNLIKAVRAKGLTNDADALQAYINSPDNGWSAASSGSASSGGGGTQSA